jgi:multidrug efflux pump subunit AcrA (membrane-fusion protein)
MAVEQERLAKERQNHARLDAQAKAELDRQRAEIESREAQARAELDRQQAEAAKREAEKAPKEAAAIAATVEAPSEHKINDFFVEDSDDEYETLVGPDGFRCVLTEPEDRSFFRDLDEVVTKLNEQLARIRELEAEALVLAGVQC